MYHLNFWYRKDFYLERVNKILSNAEFKHCLQTIETLEKDRIFCKHGITHLLDTARIGYILSLENSLNIPKDIIYATALLHDIGRYDEYIYKISHHKISKRIITILKDCNYSNDEISTIVEAIGNHNTPPTDIKTLSDVLYKADKLSRMCFNCNAQNECYWNTNKKNKTLIV